MSWRNRARKPPQMMTPSSAVTVASAVVTGATGFLGAHLTHVLLASGAQITLFVRRSSDLTRLRSIAGSLVERADIRQVSLTVAEDVRDEVLRARPDAVFHLAGDVRPRAREDDEAAMTAFHASAAQNLAEAALTVRARLV